ncbi:MAG: bifunctional adenosylcobinamide kinase/adenosylcobinamide-phosphate guanylyltransferase [Coriobacteriia bacterium]|nr:bifunctional adenosylcobinamide kinase/adenosylcobinamide-phosphate guanylyltransferase [Coriobacteriia bacterium]
MALLVLTGGARSGKSLVAEQLALERSGISGGQVIVAVFGRASDPEMAARIARHQAARPPSFETREVLRTADWPDQVADDALLLVDCLGTLIGRIIEEEWERAVGADPAEVGSLGASVASASPTDAAAFPEAMPPELAEKVSRAAGLQVDALGKRKGDTIVVTNEVGSGVVPHTASGRLFRDVLGISNRRLVAYADAAYLCVCGQFVNLRACSAHITWPEV